jgi:hypothetical protein
MAGRLVIGDHQAARKEEPRPSPSGAPWQRQLGRVVGVVKGPAFLFKLIAVRM